MYKTDGRERQLCDTICRPYKDNDSKNGVNYKNALVKIGLFVVLQNGYTFYREAMDSIKHTALL